MLALYNGKFYIDGSFKEALLIDGQVIRATGSDDEILAMTCDGDEKIDLGGRLAMAGFIDSHAHGPLSLGYTAGKIDLNPVDNEAAYLEIISKYVEEHPDVELYSGMGWINPAFESQCPDKESLDKISPDKPIVLYSGDGHSAWANSRAIEIAGVTPDTPNPQGGLIEKNPDGSLRGCFRDEARYMMLDLIPETSVEDFKLAISEYQQMMVRYGCTATFDPMVDVNSNLHKAYREMAEDDALLIKARMAYSSVPEAPMDLLPAYSEIKKSDCNKLYEGRFVKIFVDGVVEGGTAYLKDDYCNNPGYRGEPIWGQDKLNEFCAAVDKAGYDLHFHVIGDAAADQMLTAIEYINEVNGERPRNTVSAHMQIVDPADYDRLKKLDIRISSNPYWFLKGPGYFDDIEFPGLGERALKEYPMASFFDMGLVVSAASDFSVTPVPYAPLGIETAMLRTMYGEKATTRMKFSGRMKESLWNRASMPSPSTVPSRWA